MFKSKNFANQRRKLIFKMLKEKSVEENINVENNLKENLEKNTNNLIKKENYTFLND